MTNAYKDIGNFLFVRYVLVIYGEAKKKFVTKIQHSAIVRLMWKVKHVTSVLMVLLIFKLAMLKDAQNVSVLEKLVAVIVHPYSGHR